MGKRKERQSSTTWRDDRGAPTRSDRHDGGEDTTTPRAPLHAAAAVSAAGVTADPSGLPASEAEGERRRAEASNGSRKKRRKDKKKKKKKRTDEDDRLLRGTSDAPQSSHSTPGEDHADGNDEPEPPSDPAKASGTFLTSVQIFCGC
jgi:hypothetical protein